MNPIKLRNKLAEFLAEDIGDKDVTSTSIFPAGQIGKGVMVAKEDGVLAGSDFIQIGYQLLNQSIQVERFVTDGSMVKQGQPIAEVTGPMAQLLTGERVILNILQRMSGIATMTANYIAVLDDPAIHICDTRKTMPGLRMLDKYAVTCGGGKNHRFGLDDGVMIKDNHIAFAGSITKAVEKVREKIGHMIKIEVETETVDQVRDAVEAGVDIIMFDNRSAEEVSALRPLVPAHIITEASGNITLDNIATYKGTGVDYISLGCLTHSVQALDISLNVEIGEMPASKQGEKAHA